MKASSHGFTLIELIVTVAIMLLLFGASLTAFLNYRSRRAVQDEALLVAERLRTIQTKATAVEIPAGCGTTVPTSYTVSMSGGDLNVTAYCLVSKDVSSLDLSLVNSDFVGNPTIFFDSRTVSVSPATIDICGNGYSYRIEVSAAANVSKPVLVGSGGC